MALLFLTSYVILILPCVFWQYFSFELFTVAVSLLSLEFIFLWLSDYCGKSRTIFKYFSVFHGLLLPKRTKNQSRTTLISSTVQLGKECVTCTNAWIRLSHVFPSLFTFLFFSSLYLVCIHPGDLSFFSCPFLSIWSNLSFEWFFPFPLILQSVAMEAFLRETEVSYYSP